MIRSRILALACVVAVGVPGLVRAETGYDLWLRYRLVTNASRLAEYRGAIAGLLVEGDSPTLRAARDELTAGLTGLLGRPLPAMQAPAAATLIVGTPASSRTIASLGLARALAAVGPAGFVVRSMPVNGKRAIVIAANHEVGALYGAFHLLRLVQTNRTLVSLNVSSAS